MWSPAAWSFTPEYIASMLGNDNTVTITIIISTSSNSSRVKPERRTGMAVSRLLTCPVTELLTVAADCPNVGFHSVAVRAGRVVLVRLPPLVIQRRGVHVWLAAIRRRYQLLEILGPFAI